MGKDRRNSGSSLYGEAVAADNTGEGGQGPVKNKYNAVNEPSVVARKYQRFLRPEMESCEET